MNPEKKKKKSQVYTHKSDINDNNLALEHQINKQQ